MNARFEPAIEGPRNDACIDARCIFGTRGDEQDAQRRRFACGCCCRTASRIYRARCDPHNRARRIAERDETLAVMQQFPR